MTNAQAQHYNNAGHHYAQALHAGLDHAYEIAHQAALDALYDEALAEDTAREAARTAERMHIVVTASGAAKIAAHLATREANAEAEAEAWYGDDPTLDNSGLPRADWLDDDLLSGMFTAMTHDELHDEYGLQTVLHADGDYTDMFDLRHP